MNRKRSGESGFTFVEVLAVILILGVLIAVALPNYFGAEADAKTSVRTSNLRAINSALALYQFRNSGACPATGDPFLAFLENTTYFPDGKPVDPVGGGQTYFSAQYNATLCRIVP